MTEHSVETWADGERYTRIVCSRGHKRRLIDRIRYSDDEYIAQGEHLFNAAWRDHEGADEFAEESSSPAEDTQTDDAYKWRLRCPCGVNVVMTGDTLARVAFAVHNTDARSVELSVLAAIVSRQ